MLKSIYSEDVVALNDSGTCFVISIKFLSGEIKEEDVIKVWFRYCLCDGYLQEEKPIIIFKMSYFFRLYISSSCSGLSFPPNYPSVPPVFEIEANKSGSFTYRDADALFDLMMVESLKRVGEMMVFDLITMAQDHLSGQ